MQYYPTWAARMSSISRLMAILCAAALLGEAGQAGEVRLPNIGSPALVFQVPDDWVVGDERGAWIINVVNALPASVALSITITADVRDPEEYIREEMVNAGGAIPLRVGKTKIAGYEGDRFKSAGQSPSKQLLSMQHLVARIDSRFLLAVTLITDPNTASKDLALAEEIIKSMRVVNTHSSAQNNPLQPMPVSSHRSSPVTSELHRSDENATYVHEETGLRFLVRVNGMDRMPVVVDEANGMAVITYLHNGSAAGLFVIAKDDAAYRNPLDKLLRALKEIEHSRDPSVVETDSGVIDGICSGKPSPFVYLLAENSNGQEARFAVRYRGSILHMLINLPVQPIDITRVLQSVLAAQELPCIVQ